MGDQHPSISRGIIQSLSKLKEAQEFEDFKVKVDGDIYSCHSLILASCSEFFRSLLRTDMKEKQEMEVELKNISSPIFKLILNSLYTGCELLTKENVFEVWSAVHQLQIQFLIKHCEDFAVKNVSLETLEDYKRQAEYFHSVKVCQYIIDSICENFEEYRKTEAMLRMDFQDFIKFVKSDKLKVKSEDEILYSIYDWVSYRDSLPYNDNAIEDINVSETTANSQTSANETAAFSQSSTNETSATSTISTHETDATLLSSTNETSATSTISTHETDATLQSSTNETSGTSTISTNETDATLQSSAMGPVLTESCLEIQGLHSQNSTQCTDSTTKIELTESQVNKVDQNKRKKMLGHLLKATRYSLASEFCISHLFEDGLSKNDTEVKCILFQALSFKSSGYWLGYCPTSAIHRDCSKLRHVGVYCNSDKVKALCFKEDKWISMESFPTCKDSSPKAHPQYHLTVYDGELYAFTKIKDYPITFQIMKRIQNSWRIVTEIDLRDSRTYLFVANNKYIYCFCRRYIKSFNPNNNPLIIKSSYVGYLDSLKYALNFYNNIVLFSGSGYQENTDVFFYNTETLEYKQVENIKFSSKNMTSFRDDRDTYILDSNGNLWKLTNLRNIGFTFVAKLWNENFEIKGALLFRETLFIFTASPNKIDILDKVEGVFSSTIIREVSEDASNFIHYVKEY